MEGGKKSIVAMEKYAIDCGNTGNGAALSPLRPEPWAQDGRWRYVVGARMWCRALPHIGRGARKRRYRWACSDTHKLNDLLADVDPLLVYLVHSIENASKQSLMLQSHLAHRPWSENPHYRQHHSAHSSHLHQFPTSTPLCLPFSPRHPSNPYTTLTP
jgi:hypothetical protein